MTTFMNDPNQRGCKLPNEGKNLNLTKFYSKSSCEYECAIQQAFNKTGCLPWNIPRLSMEEPPFCDMGNNILFDSELKSFSPLGCNCPTDCESTTFTIFETSKKIKNLEKICGYLDDSYYPDIVLCSLCETMTTNYRIKFIYDNIMKGAPDPEIFDEAQTFCNKFLSSNVAMVKIEMATKYLTRLVNFKKGQNTCVILCSVAHRVPILCY